MGGEEQTTAAQAMNRQTGRERETTTAHKSRRKQREKATTYSRQWAPQTNTHTHTRQRGGNSHGRNVNEREKEFGVDPPHNDTMKRDRKKDGRKRQRKKRDGGLCRGREFRSPQTHTHTGTRAHRRCAEGESAHNRKHGHKTKPKGGGGRRRRIVRSANSMKQTTNGKKAKGIKRRAQTLRHTHSPREMEGGQ